MPVLVRAVEVTSGSTRGKTQGSSFPRSEAAGAAGSRSVRSRVVIVDGSLRPGSLSDGPLLSEAGEDSVQAGTVRGNKQGRDRLGFRRVWGGVRHVTGGQRRAKDEVAGVEHPSQRERGQHAGEAAECREMGLLRP